MRLKIAGKLQLRTDGMPAQLHPLHPWVACSVMVAHDASYVLTSNIDWNLSVEAGSNDEIRLIGETSTRPLGNNNVSSVGSRVGRRGRLRSTSGPRDEDGAVRDVEVPNFTMPKEHTWRCERERFLYKGVIPGPRRKVPESRCVLSIRRSV